MKKINLNFTRSLLSEDGAVSSKRFIALISLILFCVMVIAALYGKVVPEVYIYADVSLILGQSAMTLVQNNSNSVQK